jgi:hypothetical protein
VISAQVLIDTPLDLPAPRNLAAVDSFLICLADEEVPDTAAAALAATSDVEGVILEAGCDMYEKPWALSDRREGLNGKTSSRGNGALDNEGIGGSNGCESQQTAKS